jgi:hypothetical protein
VVKRGRYPMPQSGRAAAYARGKGTSRPAAVLWRKTFLVAQWGALWICGDHSCSQPIHVSLTDCEPSPARGAATSRPIESA